MADPDDRPLVARWPAPHVCVAAVGPEGIVSSTGDLDHVFPLASVTKPLVATAVMLAVEEGAVSLDDPCGPEGATARHLLAHASGIAPDDDRVLAPPATRRIYSNRGFEVLAAHVETLTGIPLAEYLAEGVLGPLGMGSTRLAGSAASGAESTVADLASWVTEMLAPGRVLDSTSVATMTAPQWPDLDGVLPGFGPQQPNPWGLGVELRGHKAPHWSGRRNSPATFGHFGRSGTLIWVDPVARLGLVALGDADFGEWAVDLWPALCDAVLVEHGVV